MRPATVPDCGPPSTSGRAFARPISSRARSRPCVCQAEQRPQLLQPQQQQPLPSPQALGPSSAAATRAFAAALGYTDSRAVADAAEAALQQQLEGGPVGGLPPQQQQRDASGRLLLLSERQRPLKINLDLALVRGCVGVWRW